VGVGGDKMDFNPLLQGSDMWLQTLDQLSVNCQRTVDIHHEVFKSKGGTPAWNAEFNHTFIIIQAGMGE
jgi:hypothetical protein